MQLADLPPHTVVAAARDGDPAAVDELVGGYLPLVYNVVGRAADPDLDVDDIVQETMLHVVAGLPALRDVSRVRSWVVFGQSAGALAVQVKRMREQLQTCQSVVRALAGRTCPELAGLVTAWDGAPSPLRRKRIARHVHGCPDCSARSERLVPPERLLAGVALAPVPASLAAATRAAATPHAAATITHAAHATRGTRAARIGRPGLHLGAGAGAKLAGAAAAVVLAAVGATAYTLTSPSAGTASASYATHARHTPVHRARPSAAPPVALPRYTAS